MVIVIGPSVVKYGDGVGDGHSSSEWDDDGDGAM